MLFNFRNKKLIKEVKNDNGISYCYIEYNLRTTIKNFLLRTKDIMFVLIAVVIVCNLPLIFNSRIV